MALLSDQLSTFWENPKYTDITIRCGSRTHQVHRIVLAAASPWFERCFDGMTSTPTSEVSLSGDDPAAVKSMLEFMYGRGLPRAPDHYSSRSFHVQQQIELYLLSCKYEVKLLQDQLLPDLESLLGRLSDGSVYPGSLDKVARLLYERTQPEAERLRQMVIKHIIQIFPRMQDRPEYLTLLTNKPALARDLTKALAAGAACENTTPPPHVTAQKRSSEYDSQFDDPTVSPNASQSQAFGGLPTPSWGTWPSKVRRRDDGI